jgi:DNA polymerase-1
MIRLVIDSNYLCYISKYALSEGLSYHGDRTEIIFGVLKDILSLAKTFETSELVFCWDSKESKRRELFKDYKSNRHRNKSDEDHKADMIAFKQFDILRKSVLPWLGFSNVFYLDGYEGDDLIASVVMNNQDVTNVVISSDNDLYQLLGYCSMFNHSRHENMTEELFARKYGISSKHWVDVKKLAGCSSDGVPGISGVGEIKAIKYVKGEIRSGKTFDAIRLRTKEEEDLTEMLVRLPFPGTPIIALKENNFSMKALNDVCDEFGFVSLKNNETWSKYFGGKR